VMQLELDRHEVVEDQGPFPAGGEGRQFRKEEAVTLLNALDLQGLRVIVEVMRGDNPGGEVAEVE
jgi:hypothetical protein